MPISRGITSPAVVSPDNIRAAEAEALRNAGLLLRADIRCNNGCGCEEYDYCSADEWDKAIVARRNALVRIANLPRCYIERRRYDGGRWHGDGDGLEVFLERLRRMRRAGWAVTVLQESATGDLVALGVLEPDAELEPDRRGQFELPLD